MGLNAAHVVSKGPYRELIGAVRGVGCVQTQHVSQTTCCQQLDRGSRVVDDCIANKARQQRFELFAMLVSELVLLNILQVRGKGLPRFSHQRPQLLPTTAHPWLRFTASP